MTTFIDATRHWVELFDQQMAFEHVPLPRRPLNVAILVVRDAILEITGGASKENYFEQDWFRTLVLEVRQWYLDLYGEHALDSENDHLSGIVMFKGTPFLLEIPSTTSRVETPGETMWLTFPDHLQSDEKISALFKRPPNMQVLPPDELRLLDASIRNVVQWTRSINLRTRVMMSVDDLGRQMAAGVVSHFEKAIENILSLKPELAAVGCWELHIAVEKAYKVFLRQKGTEPWGHALDKLDQQAAAHGLTVSPDLVRSLMPASQAINARYGALVSIDRAFDLYCSSLQLVYEISKAFETGLQVNNVSFLIKKPNWV